MQDRNCVTTIHTMPHQNYSLQYIKISLFIQHSCVKLQVHVSVGKLLSDEEDPKQVPVSGGQLICRTLRGPTSPSCLLEQSVIHIATADTSSASSCRPMPLNNWSDLLMIRPIPRLLCLSVNDNSTIEGCQLI
jgi:hypothetical protein